MFLLPLGFLSSYFNMFSCACGFQENMSSTLLNCTEPFGSNKGSDATQEAIGSVWICPGIDYEVSNVLTE
jgi:hypothetical protein